MNDSIEIKLTRTNVYTRWHCTICDGHTEKVGVLAEGEDEHGVIRVCERCLEAGDIDAKLENTAADLEAQAELTRKLIGRLRVPSFAQWKEAIAHDLEEAQA